MRTLLLCIALAISGCAGGHRPIPPPPPAPIGDNDCERAQSRLEALGCDEFLPTEGDSFAERCEYAAEDGRNVRPDCIANVTSCGAVKAAAETPEHIKCKVP
jgi:hypothetical protein